MQPGAAERLSSGAYWPTAWTAEDGGPRRWGCAAGQAGLGIQPGERLEVAASRDAFGTDMLVRREPGELFALRHAIPVGGPQAGSSDAWVERLDPDSLEVEDTSARLAAGRWWPGGMAAHANGDLHVVAGRWAHRLSPGLDVLASQRLPVDRPYNSFVVLDSGELVTKDCDAPAGLEPSTVSVLHPETLQPVAPSLPLPEPSVARLSADGKSVIAVGTLSVFRLRLDGDRLVLDDWRPRYGGLPDQSYGWDPVITGDHVFWMDNGRNHTDRTMLGAGDEAGPVRLWWSRHDDDTLRSVEISGLPHGTVSNPPAWDPEGKVVVAFDSGNAVLRAWRVVGDELTPLWRRDGFAHASHLVLHPDTRELVAHHYEGSEWLRRPLVRKALAPVFARVAQSARARRASLASGCDSVVVLDLDSGSDKARVKVPSPSQSFVFPAPGFGRDFYYQSLTTIARVAVAA